MNSIYIGLIIVAIAAWFGYALYKMLRGARGKDCATCALGSGFDYRKKGIHSPKEIKPTEFVTQNGHHIIVDEEAARRRRERIRQMMERGQVE